MVDAKIIGIVCDVTFSIFVTLLMLQMRVPTKGPRKSVAQNSALWVYVIYWLKAALTAARVVLWYGRFLDERLITLAFNVVGSMLVSLCTVSPVQLYVHYKRRGNFSHMPHTDTLWYCTSVVITYVAAFVISISLCCGEDGSLEDGVVSITEVLFVWRIWFFSNTALEAFFLVSCLVFLSRVGTTKSAETMISNLKMHLWITLYMRLGISGTIVLKFFAVLSRDLLSAVHLWFIFTGLLAYHLRSVFAPTPGRVRLSQLFGEAVKSMFKRTDQTLVISEESDKPRSSSSTLVEKPTKLDSPAKAMWNATPRDGKWVDDGVTPVPANLVVV